MVGKKVLPRLLSVNVGLPRDITWRGKTVRTAIWKTPVQGGGTVRWLNIDGDGQGDLAGHGGEHRAVFVYQIDSYHYWQSQLGRNDFMSLPKSRFERTDDVARQGSDAQQPLRTARSGVCRVVRIPHPGVWRLRLALMRSPGS